MDSPDWWQDYEGVGSSLKGGPWGNRWGATIIRFPLHGASPPVAIAKRYPPRVDGQYLGNDNKRNTMEVERVLHIKRLLDKKKRSWEAVIISPNGNRTSRLWGKVSILYSLFSVWWMDPHLGHNFSILFDRFFLSGRSNLIDSCGVYIQASI